MAKYHREIELPVKGATVTVRLTVEGQDLVIVANLMNAAFANAAGWIATVSDVSVTAKDALVEVLQSKATPPPPPPVEEPPVEEEKI